MIAQFVQLSKDDVPVFVTDVRRAFAEKPVSVVECVLVLPDGVSVKRFSIPLPSLSGLSPDEFGFAVSFVRAEMYNHLTSLGGYSLMLYYDSTDRSLETVLATAVDSFQISRPREARTEYARIVNVLDRMNDALHPDEAPEARRFTIGCNDLSELPEVTPSVEFRAPATETFVAVASNMEGTVICGLDIGGTDIKAALTVNGALIAMKEYDWNPAASADVEAIIDPIVDIARLMRLRASLELANNASAPGYKALMSDVVSALRTSVGARDLAELASKGELVLDSDLHDFDAIGLCFPDVVVRNRVVGGEVPKTRGMRRNAGRDFEKQFAELTDLNVKLYALCRDGGAVMSTNDGPMAAFTAAVELAASPTPELGRRGVFAHSLGTDLGTGLALADGSIPEIPLEVYNLILDLGSAKARELPPDDLRSLANTNTGIPGTPQKLASQAGAFRLADSAVARSRSDLAQEISSHGFVVEEGGLKVVPEEPVDQRKAYLAFLMERATSEPEIAELFRTIGEYMAVVFDETEHILRTGLDERFLFGRFVKMPECFALMQEGAARRNPGVTFIAADGEMAYTPLMKALAADPEYTVAQFGQAIGAVYFGNMGLPS